MAAKFKMGQIVEVRGNVCGLARGERAKVVAILTDTAYRIASLIHLQDEFAAEDDLCEPRWTELERARRHLLDRQQTLAAARRSFMMRNYHDRGFLNPYEEAVLAALSWVWDAQERDEGLRCLRWMKEQMERVAAEMLAPSYAAQRLSAAKFRESHKEQA